MDSSNKTPDPNSSAQLSIKNLRKAVEINPTFFLSYNNLGETYKLLARHAIQKNSAPTEFLKQAVQSFQKAIEINPDNLESYVKVAGAYEISARWKLKQNSRSDALIEINHGVENANKALDMNIKEADAHGLKGELLLLQAQASSSKQLAIEAHSSLQEAIRLNPKLSGKYSVSLQNAKEIAKL